MGILTRIRGKKDRRNCAKISPLPSPNNEPIITNLQTTLEASMKASESRMSFESTPADASRKRKVIGRIGEKFKRVMLGLFGGKKEEDTLTQANVFGGEGPVEQIELIEESQEGQVDRVMEIREQVVDAEFSKLLAMLEEGLEVEDVEFSPELLKATDDFVQCCRYQQAGLPYPDSLQQPEAVKSFEFLINVENTCDRVFEAASLQQNYFTVSVETDIEEEVVNEGQEEEKLVEYIYEAYTENESNNKEVAQTTTASEPSTVLIQSSSSTTLGLDQIFSNSVSHSPELSCCLHRSTRQSTEKLWTTESSSEEKLWNSPNGSYSDSSLASHRRRRLSPKIEHLIELFEGHLLSSSASEEYASSLYVSS